MTYKDLDRRSRNGSKRFLDFWRKITKDKECIKIIDSSDDTNLYTLQYCTENDTSYISLVDSGVTFYFPLLTVADDKINFDDEILESNLLKLFSLLNNKKNFKLI